jgi:hypothetical protein
MSSLEPNPISHAREAAAALERARALLAQGIVDEKTRAEVVKVLDELAQALEPALAARPGEARAVSHFAEALAHEATREEPSDSVLKAGVEGLSAAVERLEERYPTLVGIAQRLSDALAQIGI